MKKIFSIFYFTILFSVSLVFSQDNVEAPKHRPDNIKSGFYIKLGPVFPVGAYKAGQSLHITNTVMQNPLDQEYTLTYLPAKIGPAMDLGFLIYLGSSFLNNYVRLGIDATFLSFWFNTTNPNLSQDSKYEHYYYFAGQKFGPMITINPIDKLMIDLSYKLNANFGYHYDEWKDSNYDQGFPYYRTGGLADAQYAKFGITS